MINASRSTALKDANAFVEQQLELPRGSISARTRAGDTLDKGKIDAADWFSNWERGGVLLEEARHLKQWDQTLTLLWFENEEVPSSPQHVRRERRWETEGRDVSYRREEEDEFGLKELGRTSFAGPASPAAARVGLSQLYSHQATGSIGGRGTACALIASGDGWLPASCHHVSTGGRSPSRP